MYQLLALVSPTPSSFLASSFSRKRLTASLDLINIRSIRSIIMYIDLSFPCIAWRIEGRGYPWKGFVDASSQLLGVLPSVC